VPLMGQYRARAAGAARSDGDVASPMGPFTAISHAVDGHLPSEAGRRVLHRPSRRPQCARGTPRAVGDVALLRPSTVRAATAGRSPRDPARAPSTPCWR
jgi:hypothetical protein